MKPARKPKPQHKTRTMPAGEFKAKCLAVMEQVKLQRESVIITKHGKPVAKLVPMDNVPDDLFGFMKGRVKILGDIVSPVIPLSDWNLD